MSAGDTAYECSQHDNCDGGCGEVYRGVEMKKAIEDALEKHTQIERNRRCTCGWRPDYTKKRDNELFPEFRQHREHVAEVIFARVVDAM